MIIPFQSIPADTLNNMLEDFATRDGTDYGDSEIQLNEKVSNLKTQLGNGEAVIVFDAKLESINILSKDEYQQTLNSIPQ